MRLILCMLLSVGMLHIDAQNFRTFSQKALEKDLDYLLRNLELYGSDENNWLINDHFRFHSDSVRARLYDGMDELSFFRHVSQLLELTRQRHVRLGFSKRDPMSANAVGWNEKNAKMFPFQLKFINGRAYVWENYSDDRRIEKGAEITYINGKSIREITNRLLPFIISDGQIQVSKYYDLSNKFMLYYFWYIEDSEDFFIEYIPTHSSSQIHYSRIPAIVYRDIMRRKSRRYPAWNAEKESSSIYTYHIDTRTKSAVLQLKTFKISRFQEQRVDFKQLFKEFFTTLEREKIDQLVVDVRDNGGGNMQLLYELLSYLLPPDSRGAIKTSISIDGQPNAYKYPEAKIERFKGQLYILINSGTFSAASELASFSKVYAQATLVGEESAGLYDGYAAGYVHRFKLPHTGIRIWLPRINYEFIVPAQKEEGRGVLPDYEIIPDIHDLIEGKDTQLLYTLELIKEHQGNKANGGYGVGNN